MTLSGAGYTAGSSHTLTSSASYFTSAEIGNEIQLESADGTVVKCAITAYTSGTVVTVTVDVAVPADLQATATSSWTRAVDQLVGLWQFEGKAVSVIGDGFVLASPYNTEDFPAETVITDGELGFDACYGVIRVGLPYISDIETLEIDTSQGESLSTKKKIVNELAIRVEDSRGIWTGIKAPTDDEDDALQGLMPYKQSVENLGDLPDLLTETITMKVAGGWNNNGRVFIRQVDPLPLTVLSIIPEITVGKANE
jgi:hypothetical protein